MKRNLFSKTLALLLSLVMVLSMVPAMAFAEETATEAEDTLTVQDILGEKWSVSWNGGAVDSAEYLNIVEDGAHGKFALRIGHPTEATEMTLRYAFKKADLGVATTTGLAMCMKFKAKLEGTLLDGSWLSITNNVNNATGGNRTNLSAAEIATIGSEWSADKFVDVWCGGEYDGARVEFAISLAAGDYFYLDDIRTYGNYSGAGAMKGINVMQNGSFEQWYGSYNETALYTQDSDFVRIVDGGYSGDHALQLGSADKDTNYTLQLQLNAKNAGTYSFDLWAKTEGTVNVADVIMRNGLEGASTTYSLAGVGTEWTHIEHAAGVTDVAVDSSNLVVELHVELPAGSYLYIDDVTIVKGYSNDLSSLLSDGGFEGVSSLYYFDTTWETAINEVQKKLGEKWNVSYNAGKLASAEYLNIVEGGTHGNYSLRIGHPTESTELQLNYNFMKADLGVATATSLALCTKFDVRVDGTLNTADSWIRIIERNSDGTKTNLSTESEAAINSEWSKNYFIDVWADGKATGAQLQFAIVLEAGNYLYLDNIRTYGNYSGAGAMKNVNVMQNGSFEKWNCVWNADGEATNSEFAQLVPEGRSGNALRLGHPDKATDYTLQLPLAVPAGVGYSFDLWAKAEGEVTDAAFELFDGTTAGARRRYSLNDVGTEWTHIAHTYDVTDVWVDSGTLLVQIYVYLPAGSYLYLDDINIVRGNGATYSYDYINRLADGMFRGYALGFAQPEKPVVPEVSTFVGAHKAPAGWYTTWEGEDQYRSNYLTSDAHSGNYALALSGVESALDYTIAHSIALEEGAEYTIEGWFKKVGDFTYLSLMNGSTFKSLKNETIPTWTKYTATFTASTTKNFSIFAAAPQGGQVLVDDLVIHKSDDASKTNLLVNGDFETVAASASEMLKVDKAFTEMPVSVQAQVRLPAGAEQCGVILSNDNGKTGYTVGINSNGQPYVRAVLADGTSVEGVFTDVDVRTGEVVDLAISSANDQLSCSVNGEVKQTLDVAVPADAELYKNAFAIAGDNTADNENYFAGDLISLSVNGAESELAFWNFEGLENPNDIPDVTGNGYDALYWGEYFDAIPSAILEKYPYSFVAVGDTQYTNRGDTQKGLDYMGNLYQWIIDNQQKYNIQAVMGMGDITDTSPDTTNEATMAQSLKEWQHAVDSIGKLHSAGIPYTLVKGNHDAIPEYPENDTTVYETYLKQLGYDTQIDGWYEEEGSLANSYITLTVGETDWLILTIDQNHSLEEIAWAAGVVEAHPNHKVIVTTHVYMKANGEWVTSSDRCTMFAEDLWNGLIGQYENIEMVLCGHLHSEDVVINQRQGKGNNIVTEMLIDSQTIDKSAYTGSGTKAPYAMVTLLMFSEDGSEVMVANYSTGKGKFYHADAVQTVDVSDSEPVEEPPFGSESSVYQWGLTLGEDIGVKFQMIIEEAIASDENAQLKITVGSNEVVYRDIPEANAEGYYELAVNLAAAQMTDVITLQLVSGDQAGPEYTYSVRGYSDYILTEKPEDFDDKTKNLVAAMLVYGGKAQAYFGYNTGSFADDGITPPASAAVPEQSGMSVSDTASGIDFYGASLLFQSKTAIRYYFTATEDVSLYTFTDGDGNPLTLNQKGDMYYVQIGDIDPSELDTSFEIVVTKTDSEEAIHVCYSAMSYMVRKFHNETTAQDLKDLVQAMYDYHIAAKAMVAGNEPATIGPFQQWSCIWNGSTAPTGEFVQIVSEEAHTGEYAMRIGHPTEQTALTLQIQIPLEYQGSYEYDVWLKAVGEIGADTTIYVRDGANSPASGTKPYSLSGLDLTSWTHIGNDDGDGNKTSIWLGNEDGVLAIDILAVLPAGSYLYVDDLNVYEMRDDDKEVNVGVSLIENASFEKWDITYHAGGSSSAYDHVTIVEDVAKNGQKSLRIGHPTEYTEMTLELLVPLVGTEQCAELATWVHIDGQVTEGSGIYIRNGKTGAGGGNICFVDFSSVPSDEWTYIYNNEPELLSSIWAPTGVVAINILIGCEPGNYVYFDDLTVRKMWLSSYIDEAPNLIGDPGFERTDFSDAYNRPAAPFASNMVLQRNASVPVFGTGNDGDTITVSFGGQTKTTTVQDGQWRVDLDPMQANTVGQTMVIKYPERLFVFNNVLVGEVWLASGQSNMALQVQQLKEEAQAEYAAVADNALVRLYNQPAGYAQVPQVTAGDVSAWAVSSAESIGPHSAIGAAFGLRIQEALGENIPVGIVVTANGGTYIEQWLDAEHLEAAGGNSVDRDDINETLCYNYQVAQLVPFRFAGALWYQGCNNCHAGNIDKYPALFNALVEQWREEFEYDMPFIVFQLVQYGGEPESSYGDFRVMQWDLMETTENVYTVVGIDHGEADDIHPSDKLTYGYRAGDLALNVVYGQTEKAALSPSAVSAVMTDTSIVVSFENIGGGLLLTEGTEVANVEIMVDGAYQPATATLVDNQLVVDITGITGITAVSYGVENVMETVNLYSQNGLPVAPFILTEIS